LPVCLSIKKKPNAQIFCCACRVWGSKDFCTIKGVALFLLSGGFVVFVFLVLMCLMLLFGAGIFIAIEPDEFAPQGYGRAIYFTIISVTTIGYGDYTLKCTSSRILEFFFVIFGIPLTAVTLTMLGSQFWQCLKVKKPKETDGVIMKNVRKVCSKAPWCGFACVWILALLICAVIFSNMAVDTTRADYLAIQALNNTNYTRCDNFLDKFFSLTIPNTNSTWPYAQSFYFTWVTLTTIGYGDYYQTSDEGITLVCFVAIMGVGYFTLIVSKIGVYVEKCFHKKFKGVLKRMKLDGEYVEKEKKEEAEEPLQDLEVKVQNGDGEDA